MWSICARIPSVVSDLKAGKTSRLVIAFSVLRRSLRRGTCKIKQLHACILTWPVRGSMVEGLESYPSSCIYIYVDP